MVKSILRAEAGLIAAVLSAVSFTIFGKVWLADLTDTASTALFFAWLFLIMLWAAFAVVATRTAWPSC